MSEKIGTLLTKKGQELTSTPSGAGRINAMLSLAMQNCAPLVLDEAGFEFRHIHIDCGAYPSGRHGTLHVHENLQLQFIYSGEFLFKACGNELLLKSGMGCIIPQGEEHEWICVKRGVMLGAIIGITGKRSRHMVNYLRLNMEKVPAFIQDKATSEYAKKLFELAMLDKPHPWRGRMLGNILGNFLAECLCSTLDFSGWQNSGHQKDKTSLRKEQALCTKALLFIEDNLDKPIHVRDIAARCAISTRHLNRIFSRVMGESVNNVLLETRLAKAQAMLASPEMYSVKEVTYATGFRSQSYFSSCFRKRFGLKPSEVCKNI